MSEFEVKVRRIEEPVVSHPDADRLSIVKIDGYLCIAAKNEGGSHRYAQGDLVVYIPEQAVLPNHLMKHMGFWDETTDKPAFRKVKAKKLRGIFSQGVLYPVETHEDGWFVRVPDGDGSQIFLVNEGDDVANLLGITKWEPKVPAHMAGQLGPYSVFTKSYDFDSIQKQMRLFEPGEMVEVTEKIHGTNMQIGWIPDERDDGWFGTEQNIYVTSKGIGAKGFTLKNVEANANNLYVRQLTKLLDRKLEENLRLFYPTERVHLFGEVYGKGVQDLEYGTDEPAFGLFDIMVNGEYLCPHQFNAAAGILLLLPTVPLLYMGQFSAETMIELRDGKTTFAGGPHLREGIVIKSIDQPRKIAKWVSPDYLLRKGNVTEYA